MSKSLVLRFNERSSNCSLFLRGPGDQSISKKNGIATSRLPIIQGTSQSELMNACSDKPEVDWNDKMIVNGMLGIFEYTFNCSPSI